MLYGIRYFVKTINVVIFDGDTDSIPPDIGNVKKYVKGGIILENILIDKENGVVIKVIEQDGSLVKLPYNEYMKIWMVNCMYYGEVKHNIHMDY